jgi:hypothetical protein
LELGEEYYHEASQAWRYTPIISAFRRLRQRDSKFKASLSYVVKPYILKKNITMKLLLEI